MKRSGILFLIFLLTGFSGLAGGIVLPAEARIVQESPPDGRTWEQCGTMRLSYVATRQNFDLALRRQGWTRIKTVEYDRIHWKTLELWSRGKERILIQYWREDVSLTGFSWGRVKEGK